MTSSVRAGVLQIAYESDGPEDGLPVVLLHGFPYDVRAFSEVGAILAGKGYRTYTPYLRGYGPTRFLSEKTPRSGQQAALAHDLLSFMDAIGVESAVLAGYDWGGRAACIVAALWRDRVRALVSCGGYNIQNIPAALEPRDAKQEWRLWYQYYFHGERGRRGLAQNRDALCKLLWQQWSPSWRFSDEQFRLTARSFSNPDFVETVIHSYRHRYGLANGDRAYAQTERLLVSQPKIAVPSIVLHGCDDGVLPPSTSVSDQRFFSSHYERIELEGVGHNVPQEDPKRFADAIIQASKYASSLPQPVSMDVPVAGPQRHGA